MNAGETHVLMGPNGGEGKSTLGYALMEIPNLEITERKFIFLRIRILTEAVEKGRQTAFPFPSRIRWRCQGFPWGALSAAR